MAKMVVVLEWSEENLGMGWMNSGNLDLCLFSKEHTLRELLTATVIATEEDHLVFKPNLLEEPIENSFKG